MKVIKCVECGNEIKINIANAIDENGEVFRCKHCGFIFRFTNK